MIFELENDLVCHIKEQRDNARALLLEDKTPINEE